MKNIKLGCLRTALKCKWKRVYTEIVTIETRGLCMKDEMMVALNHKLKPDKQATEYNHGRAIQKRERICICSGRNSRIN